MAVKKGVASEAGTRIKVTMIKCGGDGRKEAYKYLALLALNRIERP